MKIINGMVYAYEHISDMSTRELNEYVQTAGEKGAFYYAVTQELARRPLNETVYSGAPRERS